MSALIDKLCDMAGCSKSMLLFNALYFIAIADVTSIDVGGVNIRWAWCFLPLIWILTPKSTDDKRMFVYVIAFFAVHMLSSAISLSIVKGFVYSAWILINYLFFVKLAYSLTKNLKEDVWNAFIVGGRLQAIVSIVLVILDVHERARFIYFEPSYFALGLVPYIFCAIFWSKNKNIDIGLIILVLIFNQSANMLICLVVVLIIWLIYNKKLMVSSAILAVISMIFYGAFLYTLQDENSPNHGLAVIVSESELSLDLVEVFLRRGGNRLPRFEAALEVVDGNYLFGIGPGNYNTLTEKINFDHISSGIDYLDPSGLPVINVVLESVVNAGVLAAVVMMMFYADVWLRIMSLARSPEKWMMLGCLVAFGLMLQFESSYLRAYVWFAIGVFVARVRFFDEKRRA